MKKLLIGFVVGITMASVAAAAAGTFSDVPSGAFYESSVDWAAANNITSGFGDGTFRPEAPVTRGQLVTFLKRYNDNVVSPGPVLPTPIANGCTLTGIGSLGWTATLSFSSPQTTTRDAWIDWAIRDSTGVRVSSEFDIVDLVLAGESVQEPAVTFYNGPAASCDILAISWKIP